MLDPIGSVPDAELSAELAAETQAPTEQVRTAATTPKRPSLWGHADYRKLWSAATVSLMGTQVSQLAIPYIAAIVLGASVFQVALLGTVEMLPFILFTLPAGAWLDRVRRRPVLIAGDLGRAAALTSIPLAYAAGVLSIWQLYAVGFITGLLTVLFDVADQSYLPVILDADDLVEGNAKLQVSAAAAQFVGPGLAGGILAAVAAPFAIIIDAASFVVSGSFIALIRKHEPKPERKRAADGTHTSLPTEIAEGLRYVLGNRYLRMIAASTGTSNLGSSLLFSILAVFVYRELGLSPLVVGLSGACAGGGLLLGAMISAPLARRFGVGPVIIGSMFMSGLAAFPIVFLPSQPILAGVLLGSSSFALSAAAVVYNVNQVSFRQAITPLDMQGRMNATMRFIVWGVMPIGSVLGGLLGSVLPLRLTILLGAILSSTAFVWVLASPVRSLRDIPKASRSDAVASD